MWKRLLRDAAAPVSSSGGRPLAQRPAGGQLHLSETDPGPASSHLRPPDGAVQDAAFPWCLALRLHGDTFTAATGLHRLPGGPAVQRRANPSGGCAGVGGVREQTGVWGVRVLQRGGRLQSAGLPEWREVQRGRWWR